MSSVTTEIIAARRVVHRGERRRVRDGDGALRLVHPRAPHGTSNGYSYYCCRCLACTQAHADGQRRLRADWESLAIAA